MRPPLRGVLLSVAILAAIAIAPAGLAGADAGSAAGATPSSDPASAGSPAPASDPVDGVVLSLTPGPGTGEVTLRWTGGLSPYTVYRSTDKTLVIDAANQQGQTNSQAWIDAPPAGDIFYYKVTAAGCASNGECPTGFCVDSVCCDTACSGTCEACDLAGGEGTCLPIPAGQDPAGECGAGASCDGIGACRLANGGTCTLGSECLSGFCADGVCCNTACDGVCEQCNAAGSVGSCTAAPAGTDPGNDCPIDPTSTCGRTGVCSGSGACALYPAGTVCAAGGCASTTSANREDTCDGSGTCVDNGVQDCTPYVCNAASGTCGTFCSSSADCAGGFVCNLAVGQCEACTPGPDAPDLTFADTNCDGIDGDASAAIFVDVLSGNDANPGTRALPKATIGAGIAAAAAAGKDVYISKGAYSETITLADGVGLYGGYDRATGWSRSTANLTRIVGGSTAVSGTGLSSPTELQLLSIVAASATASGGSSYGLYLIDSTAVTVRACDIQAGNGAGGSPGLNGAPGSAGSNGFLGAGGCENSTFLCNACSQPQGGAPGTSSCGTSGGRGGSAGLGSSSGNAGGTGVGGTPGGPGTPSGWGNWNTPSTYWGALGLNGAAGPNGLAGSPGYSSTGYVPSNGTTGVAGNHGNGGGGGGGGGGGTTSCDSYGGGGGGGGGGGCGGGPASGGQSAGGSFAIYLWASTAQIENCSLTAGGGGNGGTGGTGGNGGSGGSGAKNSSLPGAGNSYGGSAEQDDGSNGGRGGDGGAGGRGGHGGGGAGGPSIGIVCVGGSSRTGTGNSFTLQGGGSGGLSPGSSGPAGSTAQSLGC
jgi:hypothetical protein